MPHLRIPGHNLAVKIEHLLCDKRFWGAVGIILLIAGFLALLIWAAQQQNPGMNSPMYGPIYPYTP
jgi:hypothetical protein